MAESFNSLYMRDPAAADRQRRAAQAQALMRAGSDASALQGTGNNSMQAIARALQGITGGVMAGLAGREAQAAGDEMKAAEKAKQQNIAAALSGMPLPGAEAPSQAPAMAPPMTENLGGAPNANGTAPVPQVQSASLPAGPLSPQTASLLRGQESGGNPNARNPRSTATGADQFINGTWMEYARANPGRFQGMDEATILARRTDPEESGRATQWYAGQNGRALTGAGLPAGPGELTLAHRFGPAGAQAALRADPNLPAEQVFGAEVMRANPDLVGKTVGQVVGQYQSRYGGGVAGRTGGTDVAGPGVPQAPQQAQAQPPGRSPEQLRRAAALMMASPHADERAAAQMLWSQANSIEQQQGQAQVREEARAERTLDNRRADEQLALTRQAQERAERAERLRLETSEWMPDPNNPGGLLPRPGGPQDPAVITRRAEAAGQGRGGRVMPSSERNNLVEAATRIGETTVLRDTFKDEYGGFMAGFVGDAVNFAGRNTPGESPRADWWARYQSQKNQVRNALFGAALTPGEQAEYEKSDINPGMSADAIRTNLKRQAEIISTAQRRRVRSMAADGYNTRALLEASGIDPEAEPEAPPAAGDRPPLSSFQR